MRPISLYRDFIQETIDNEDLFIKSHEDLSTSPVRIIDIYKINASIPLDVLRLVITYTITSGENADYLIELYIDGVCEYFDNVTGYNPWSVTQMSINLLLRCKYTSIRERIRDFKLKTLLNG